MHKVFKFIVSDTDRRGNLLVNIWIIASEHSQLVDAEIQLQRFIDSGIPVEQLKIVSDDSDPNAPIVPPEQPSEEPLP